MPLSAPSPMAGCGHVAGAAVGTWGSREAFGAWQAVQAADAVDAGKTCAGFVHGYRTHQRARGP